MGAGPEPANAWSAVPWPQMATRAGSQLQASPPRWQLLQSLIRPETRTRETPNSSVAATWGLRPLNLFPDR